MNQQIRYERLTIGQTPDDLLDTFDRFQQVKRCWQKHDGSWVLKQAEFTEDWDLDKRRDMARELRHCLQNGGAVYCARGQQGVVGYAALTGQFFGTRWRYLQLLTLQVSYGFRRFGIGRRLFGLVAEEASTRGAQKLYISAHPSEESQAFYLSLGCTDAQQVNAEIAEAEPYDRQMEFVL